MSSESGAQRRVFFREAIGRAVREALLEDPRVLVIGQDVAAFGGSYREFADSSPSLELSAYATRQWRKRRWSGSASALLQWVSGRWLA